MPEINSYYQTNLTLPAILKRAASNENAFAGFFNDKEEANILTYDKLLQEATHLAIGLANEGLKQGDKLVIATSTNQETLILLWACFLSGIVPTVLQPPPTFSGYNPPVVKLVKVSEQLEKPLIFMSSLPSSEDVPDLNFRSIEQLNCNGTFKHPDIKPGDLAFIQFSSGSTGDPKGIMLTHFNILVNLDAIRVGLDFQPGDVTGNWMPLFHDMGLIGYHLVPLYCSIIQWHIETIDFIKNPGLWLNLLTKYKVKITGCPNFGLALSLRFISRMKNKPEWDFSSLQGLLNGAEPISVQIMNDFVNELKPFNFRPEAMMPVYGLAEATLAVTFTPLMKPYKVTAFDVVSLDRDGKAIEVQYDESSGVTNDPNKRLIAGVGVALNDIEIKITDHDYNPLPEGFAGLISIKGDSVTGGYYNKIEDSRQAYHDGWFNTGDIGFLYKGFYYVSGRHKDIIFRNGRHYFANDLEELACSVEGISYGKVCFAGISNRTNGQEQVIAFIAGSPGEKARETFHQLRNLLRSTLGITLDEVVMVRSNEIPKTSSGKLQRYKLIQRFLAGEFDSAVIN
jgi:fengycin family lipopeptide synthetase D